MKKIYIALAVLSATMLVSCQQEQPFNDINIGEFDVAFSIANGATRSSESTPLVREIAGQSLVLEESIVDLDQIGAEPITRGTPAYTENLGVLYANELLVQGNKGGFTTEKGYWNMDTTMVQGGWRYQGSYDSDPWPVNENDTVQFYFRMPSTQEGVTNITRSGGKFNFSYTSPATAKTQQDILFASRPLTKAEHKTYLKKGGTPILFNHALTGVKFAIGNDASELATAGIKSVTISGLINKGTCELTPAKEEEYRDEPDSTFSSQKAAKWTLTETSTGTFSSGEFGNPVEYKNNGKFENNGKYGDSFAPSTINNPKANTQNLNDTDGTQTFWFIPQAVGENVKLTIEFTVDGGKTYTEWEVDFGKALGGVEWKAGQLRTYTIKIDMVNLKIEDAVSIQNATSQTTPYKGSSKDDVVIKNTGNTDAFIRAAIVGQWLNYQGKAVFGFTDKKYNFYAVPSWYQDQFVSTEDATHGKFTDLAGYKGAQNPLSNWYLCTDGYYYYSLPVAPGKIIGTAPENATNPSDYLGDPLFTSYTVGDPPKVTIAGVNTTIHFSLEISTQAVSANKNDGSHYTWQEAWKNATGTQPTVKSNQSN